MKYSFPSLFALLILSQSIFAAEMSEPNDNVIEDLRPIIKNGKQSIVPGEYELVLSTPKNLVGSVRYSVTENEGYIDNLFVYADHRGRGYGSKLLKAAITNLEEMECNIIELRAMPTEKDNFKKLVKFYTQHGFVYDSYELQAELERKDLPFCMHLSLNMKRITPKIIFRNPLQ